MKSNVLISSNNNYTECSSYREEVSEIDEILLNNNGYIYVQTEYKHATKVARTLKINGGPLPENRPVLRKTSKTENYTQKEKYPAAMESIKEYNCKSNKENQKLRTRKLSAPIITRKSSIARIGSAFREFQQTMKPRRVRGRKTTDCNFTEIEEASGSQISFDKKPVSRSASLPNIKSDKDGSSRRGSRKNNLLRKLSTGQKQNKSTPVLDFETTDIISFPSNRLEGYRTKSQDKILNNDEFNEGNALAHRRKQGRSRSVQLPSDSVVCELNRERSFSTDCDDHLFSFDKLVERRLNLSKETQLCETDL